MITVSVIRCIYLFAENKNRESLKNNTCVANSPNILDAAPAFYMRKHPIQYVALDLFITKYLVRTLLCSKKDIFNPGGTIETVDVPACIQAVQFLEFLLCFHTRRADSEKGIL